jgi:hypothetical protein
MAVCGCCWICRRKLDCGEGKSCYSCDVTETHAAVVELADATKHDLSNPVQVCRQCVSDIESGILMSLLEAMRETREQIEKQAKERVR